MNAGGPGALGYLLAKASHAGMRALARLPGARVARGRWRILVFHDISPEQLGTFERLLRYLLDTHRVFHPEDAAGCLAGRASVSDGPTAYLLTFDDGFRSQAAVAREILNAHGVKAVFFVCPGLIDAASVDHRGLIAAHVFDGQLPAQELPAHTALMAWEDLEELAADGHVIGSHTLAHRRLSTLSPADLQSEIAGAADRLTARLRVFPEWFAYPFGNLGSVSASAIDAIGQHHRFCCSGIRGANGPATPPLGLLREAVDLAWPFDMQRHVVEGGLDVRYTFQRRRLHTLARQGQRER